jgi:hypothetical protein
MALTAHKPTAWKYQIEQKFRNLPIFEQALCNNHYEGELKKNATLEIVSIGNVTTTPYTGAWDLSTVSSLATTKQSFEVDQSDTVIFRVKLMDDVQGMLNLMQLGTVEAAEAMSLTKDTYLSGFHTSITTNLVGSDGAPETVGFDQAAGNILPSRFLSAMYTKMAESNAKQQGANIVVPVWLGSMILQELQGRNTQLGDSNVASGVTTGLLPGVKMGGFAGIYVSNNVDNTAGSLYKIMAGAPDHSITTASVIDLVRFVDIPNDFAQDFNMLAYHGAKVPFEKHMALGTVNIGSYSA